MGIALSRAFGYSHNSHYIQQLNLAKSCQFPTRFLKMAAARPINAEFVREDLEDLLKRRFFIARSFDIYGGVAGLYDLGVKVPF